LVFRRPRLPQVNYRVLEGCRYLPIVYNTGGYDSPETLDLLDGVVDIYMPDIKFGDDKTGRKYAGAAGYFPVSKQAVKKMHGQVGDLVLPWNLARTERVAEFLAKEIPVNTFVNIMDQYYPAYKAFDHPELSRRITRYGSVTQFYGCIL